MNKNIERFLTGTLWLIASFLAACFWFNARFGFNILSANHWQYFGQLQASTTPIDSGFYINIVITVFVMSVGLYLIVKTRIKKLNFATITSRPVLLTPAPVLVSNTEPSKIINNSRPPRLNLPTVNNYQDNIARAPDAPAINLPSAAISENTDAINQIFSSAGYLLKKCPKSRDFSPIIFAIGSDEVLWIGAQADDINKLQSFISKISSIFTDTLEDIEITINGFIINAPGTEKTDYDDIIYFNSAQDLREKLPFNKKLESDTDQENFDAYSEYIDTVSQYFNKL